MIVEIFYPRRRIHSSHTLDTVATLPLVDTEDELLERIKDRRRVDSCSTSLPPPVDADLGDLLVREVVERDGFERLSECVV